MPHPETLVGKVGRQDQSIVQHMQLRGKLRVVAVPTKYATLKYGRYVCSFLFAQILKSALLADRLQSNVSGTDLSCMLCLKILLC